MKRIIWICFFLLSLSYTTEAKNRVRVEKLRIGMLENPVGLDTEQPRFMWQLVSGEPALKQRSYEIEVADSPEALKKGKTLFWKSGVVYSDNTLFIPYEGDRLQSRKEYFWRVRVNTNQGTTGWSDIQTWTMGWLDGDKWKAEWIGENKMANPGETDKGNTRLAARYLRKEFENRGKVKRAVLYVSGLGSYEAYLNGRRIGDHIFSPSISHYTKTVYYNVFDVTREIKDGNNTLGAVLGNGRYFWLRNPGTVGYGLPRLLANLEIEYADGTTRSVVTDTSWKITSQGPIMANNEFDGEEYDASRELTGWSRTGYDDRNWKNAGPMEAPGGVLRAQPNPPIRVMDRIRPIDIRPVGSGKYIIDMGQNMVGRLTSTLRGKAGKPVTFRFAEILKEDGSLFTDNLRTARATNVYIPCNDETFTWKPAFVYHGFRYVEVDGLAETPKLDDFSGEVMYDEMETTGTFETSNEMINRIHRNAFWGIRGNYRAMPTDCPQRDERMGWLGDRATGCFGESYILSNGLLYSKWLQDIEDSQSPEGRISVVSPLYWTIYADDVTWPAAYLYAAEMLYKQYGDKSGIVRHYGSMKKWVERIRDHSMKDSIVFRDQFGDWCMPPESQELIHSNDPSRKTDGAILSSTMFYNLLHKMEKFARIAGHEEDGAIYRQLASAIKQKYNQKYFDYGTARYGNNTVTGNLLSLRFGLVPEGYEQRVFDNIVDKTETDCRGHVSAGVVGIQQLMRGLTEYGRKDIAYRLTSQDTYPSWGYMVKKGATTIWELWNGDTAAPEMNSANHVMLLGDLIIWYYENLAGIKNADGSVGFHRIEMAPCFPEGLDHVKASYRSVSGEIKSEWKRTPGTFSWKVSIPGNTTATIRIPVRFCGKCPNMKGILNAEREGDYWVVEAGSGDYLFQ